MTRRADHPASTPPPPPQKKKITSQLFLLQASGQRELTHRMCGWERLPNKDVPMIFHCIIGEDMQEANSPSFFNPHEVSLVMKYVRWLVNEKSPTGTKIKEEHIGIISPYRKQVSGVCPHFQQIMSLSGVCPHFQQIMSRLFRCLTTHLLQLLTWWYHYCFI